MTNIISHGNTQEKSIMNYNSPFFTLFENVFKLIKDEYNQEKALEIFSKLMEKGLGKSYGNDFVKGQTSEFIRLVKERDNMVGLRVAFPLVTQNEIIYQFLDDPFPNLKGCVDESKLDNCFISFKIKYILGEDWSYINTKHLWRGDKLTEYKILNKFA